MKKNYKKQFDSLWSRSKICIRTKRLKPLLEFQLDILRLILRIEKRIRRKETEIDKIKSEIGALRNTENRRNIGYLADEIDVIRVDIESYKRTIFMFKTLVDAIAFTFIDKWDVKPLSMKQTSGFLSGKTGLRAEIYSLKNLFKNKIPALLNDITTCLKHGDITILAPHVPILLEVKSSEKRNERVERQEKNLEDIQRYLVEDKLMEGNSSQSVNMKRVSIHTAEKNHITAVNKLLAGSYQNGSCYRKIEPGLYYWVTNGEFSEKSKSILKAIIKKCQNQAIHLSINDSKYYHWGYFPLSLSLHKKEYFWDLYLGKLMFSVFVDPFVIEKYFHEKGMRVEFRKDGYIFTIRPSLEPTDPRGMNFSEHFFGRIGYEFISLKWFLDELHHKVRVAFPK